MPLFIRRLFQFALVLAIAGALLRWFIPFQAEPDSVERGPSAMRAENLPPSREPAKPSSEPISKEEPATDSLEPFTDFAAWAERYQAASANERPLLVTEGIFAAEKHRTALAALISTDPRLALELAVPMVVRQELPAEIVKRLEERVSAKGFFGVLGAVGQPLGAPVIRREVRVSEKRYEAYTYGARLTQTTTADEAINGIAIDHVFALSEHSFRVLEIGERIDARALVFNTCPVSGKSAGIAFDANVPRPPIDEQTPAVEIAGEIHYLCDGRHLNALAEGGTGGPTKPTGTIPTTQSTGVRTLLYIRVAFPETGQEPQTEAAAYAMMKQVNDFMVENSYGNIYLLTTVTPLVILPRSEAWYVSGGGDEFILQTDAQTAAKRLGYDTGQYDHDVVAYTGGPGTFGGLGYVGSKGIWLRTINAGIVSHELGHNFGLWHANAWDTGNLSIIGSGLNAEYGNLFDTMGSATAGDRHFNACHKSRLNWLPRQGFVHQVAGSGTYRLFAHDQPRLDPGSRYAIVIPKDRAREYWLEFRQKSFSGNPWIRDGILLTWAPWTESNGGTQLLDTTPGSPDERNDAGVVIGRTFSDFESGIHITPVGKAGTVPESVDVVVNLGQFPGNQAPTATISASTLNPSLSTVVNFAASAIDPDGDAMSYAWDFGDKTFSNTNSASVSKSWPAPGNYVVRCVVSDMKGHATSNSVTVHAGLSTTFSVSGQILINGQPLADVRLSNGLSGTDYRGTFADSDGRYTIAGLISGSVTIRADLYGYTFVASFGNPVQVDSDITNADFSANQAVMVTLAVADSDCGEGLTNTGSFRLTRTGSTVAPLIVSFLNPPRGSAVAGAGFDYVFSPDPLPAQNSSAHYYTATIQAGQSSLDIIVTATDDTQLEGPETVTLEMVPRPNYVIGGPESATLTILDNDTSLPSATLQILDGDGSETGDTASFSITRTGSTSAALNVNVTYSGTATSGTDFVNPGSQITIPAGALSTLLVITPLNDNIAEGTETVTVSLGSAATYIPSGVSTENSGTVNILDDDLATLTVAAADPSASESNGDTGTFLVTRTGPTTLPLTINYALGGSATHGVDYERLPGVLTIPAGASFASVTVIPIDDAIGEPSQTVSLQLRSGITHVVGNPGSATVTILDNSDVPVVTVGTNDGVMSEPSSPGSFRFTTTGTGSDPVTIHYTVTGTATPDSDYVALSGTLTMGRNGTVDLIVTPIDDVFLENVETIIVTITPDPAYKIFLDTSATLNLVDDDQAMVSISTTNIAFSETGGTGRYWISRSGSNTSDLSVNYSIGGSATNGDDYQPLSGVIVVPAGSSGVSLNVAPINDTLREGAESLTISIAPGTYGIGLGTATLYLTDDDAPTVQVKFASSTGSSGENAGLVNIPIVLTAAASTTITVECVINGGTATGRIDYAFVPGTVTFLPGETSKVVALNIVDDAINEPSETIVLRLQNANGAAIPTGIAVGAIYTHTVTNNDALSGPQVGFTATGTTSLESQTTASIAVSLSAPQTSSIATGYSVTGGTANMGTDYTLASGTLTFSAGETVRVIPLTIADDSLSESSETVVLSLNNPTGASIGANASFTYTIADDDAPVLTISASDAVAAEFGNDVGVFTLTRMGNLSITLTPSIAISGSAVGGTDFQTLPASVAFAVNTATATIEVLPLPDSLAEGDETVTATIVPDTAFAVGAQDHATVTIRDLPIDGWRWAKFGATANTPAVAGDLANPDFDALPNLLEFALSSEPTDALAATIPQLTIEGNEVSLIYSRQSSLGDVALTIEKWSAPNRWLAVPFSEEIVSESGGTQVVKDRVPLGGAEGMMLRLRATRPAQ